MVTWLTRSLIFIVGGAVLAFAVTTRTITYHSPKHGATMDVRAVGVILLLVGVCVSMYLRDTGQPMDPYVASRAALGAPATVTRQVYATTPDTPAAPARTVHDTQPIPPQV
jgi:hypothetical protein